MAERTSQFKGPEAGICSTYSGTIPEDRKELWLKEEGKGPFGKWGLRWDCCACSLSWTHPVMPVVTVSLLIGFKESGYE